MVNLFAAVCTVALACSVAVQGASLVERADPVCPKNDVGTRICETSGGSPLVSDCREALRKLGTKVCPQTNSVKSHCQTQYTYGSCKIDACGQWNSLLTGNVPCETYLQSLIDGCQSGGRVGGQVRPADCNVKYEGNSVPKDKDKFRVQFSYHKQ